MGNLSSGALLIVVAVISIAVGAQVVGQMNTVFSEGLLLNETSPTSVNITGDGLAALEDFSDWFAIVVLVIVAGVVLAIVMRSFSGGRGGI